MRLRLIVSASIMALAMLGGASTPSFAQKKVKPPKPSVCKDGSSSTSAGTAVCAGHGGIDSVATVASQRSAKAAKARLKADKAKLSKTPQKVAQAEAKAEKAEEKLTKAEERAAKDPLGATAQCKDGTYSHALSTQGACARHGGVAKTLKP